MTLPLVKLQVRFLTTNEDDLLNNSIAAARTIFEEYTGRQILDATWRLALDRPPCHRHVVLPRPPLSGDVVITYDDANGDPQTVDPATYTVEPSFLSADAIDPYCQHGKVVLNKGQMWPTVSGEDGCFRVDRTCGYGATTDAVPNVIRSVLMLLVAHLHRNRAEVMEAKTRGVFQQLPFAADAMMKPFKVFAPPGLHHEYFRRFDFYDESRFWGWGYR